MVGFGMPPLVSNHVDELNVGVGASNNDLDLGVQMARALDEAWQTCDSVVEGFLQQTRDENRQYQFNLAMFQGNQQTSLTT
jgi:hypothetical protein